METGYRAPRLCPERCSCWENPPGSGPKFHGICIRKCVGSPKRSRRQKFRCRCFNWCELPDYCQKKPAILTAQVELFVTDPQEANLDSFTEEGTYNHFWTAVDDGAVNNALVQACEKIIPRLLASPALKRYADGLRGKPEIRDTMHTQPLPEVMIHDVYLAPLDSSEKRIDIAHKGQPFDMVILYSISGLPQNKRMACLEKRQISFGGKILLEDKRMEQRGNGDYSTSIKLTLPHAAQAGDYVLSGVIQWEDKELSKSFRFSIE
jgi:hypothetical protein